MLNEVRDGGAESRGDVQRLYEIWRKTGSARALAQLESRGVTPLFGAPAAKRH